MTGFRTRILECEDDSRQRTVILSDLHLRREGGIALEMFRALCERESPLAASTRMLVLGDLFDVWVTDAQVGLPCWDAATVWLGASVQRGMSVTVIHGNRDFMLGRRFARATGCRVHSGGLKAKIAGRDTLLLHGDELCLRDTAYQRARRYLRNPLLRGALRLMPAPLALHFAGRARRVSAKVQTRARAGAEDDLRYEATRDAIDAAFAATGCQVLIHGHVHRAARSSLPGGRELVVLPAFDEAGVHLVADAEGLRFRDAGGRVLPDFPPRPPV